MVGLSTNKNDLNESLFFNEFSDKMVLVIHIFCPRTCCDILGYKKVLQHCSACTVIIAICTRITMLNKIWMTNLVSFAASDKATNTTLLEERVPLFCPLNFQDTETLKR
jgi:hypothetical protein